MERSYGLTRHNQVTMELYSDELKSQSVKLRPRSGCVTVKRADQNEVSFLPLEELLGPTGNYQGKLTLARAIMLETDRSASGGQTKGICYKNNARLGLSLSSIYIN